VATLPHFYGGHPTYEKMIDGINPDPKKHQIFLEVEPRTGSPLRGGKKAQFNMFLKKIDYISKFRDKLDPVEAQTKLFYIFSYDQ